MLWGWTDLPFASMLWVWTDLQFASMSFACVWLECGECSEFDLKLSVQVCCPTSYFQCITDHISPVSSGNFYIVRTLLHCQDIFPLVWTVFHWRNSTPHVPPIRYAEWTPIESQSKRFQKSRSTQKKRIKRSRSWNSSWSRGYSCQWGTTTFFNLPKIRALWQWILSSIDSQYWTSISQSRPQSIKNIWKIWPLGTTSILRLYVVESLYKWAPLIPHQWLWPFILTGACNLTSTVLHHGKNKNSSTDFFNPSILQDQHQSQQTHLLTSNISNHSDKFYLLQIIAPHQLPEAVVPLSLPPHHEKVENDVLCPFPSQTFSVLVSTRPQKVVQKLNIVVSQIRAYQLALALNGLTNWNNTTMDIAGLL